MQISKTLIPNKDTSYVFIELEEGVKIYITTNTHNLLSGLDKNQLCILIEVNQISRPTYIKYQYIIDNETTSGGFTSTANTFIKITINNHWNKYLLFKQELDGLNLSKKSFESDSTTLKQSIDEFLKYSSDYSNHKLPLLSAFYSLIAALYNDSKKNINEPLTNRDKLQLIENIIVKNFTNRPPTIESLALLVGMSVSKMKLLFKDYYGESIYQFHQRAKLNYAAELLKTQRYTVSQVAYKVGYSQSIKFIKIFEKHFGVTPGKFKTTHN